jgi:hypothetical protein
MKSSLNKNLQITLIAAILSVSHAVASPTQAIGIDYVHGEGGVNGLRIVYHPHLNKISETKTVKISSVDIDLNYEFSLNMWQFYKNSHSDNNWAVAFSPVFSKQFSEVYGKPLKWEAGIGISLVKDTKFAGKDIGSHYQFEDRIGLKVLLDKLAKKSISVRYIHYSNGGLNDKNPGLDFINISYTIRF